MSKVAVTWFTVEREGGKYKIFKNVEINGEKFSRYIKEENNFDKALNWTIEQLKGVNIASEVKEIKLNLDYLQYLICTEINATFGCVCFGEGYCKTVRNIAESIITELSCSSGGEG